MLSFIKNLRVQNVLALILACIMIATCLLIPGGADTTLEEDKNKYKDLENQLSQIKSSQNKLQDSIKKAKEEKNSAIKLKNELDKEIALIIEEIDLYNQLIEEYNKRGEKLEGSISELEADMYNAYLKFKERIVAIHEMGSAEYIDFLLESGDFSDFLSRFEYVSDLMQFERNVLNEINNDKESLDLKVAELNMANSKLADFVEKSEEKKAETEIKKADANSLIETYEKDIVKNEQLEREAKQDMDDLKDIMTTLAKQIKNKEEELYAGGLMKWPLDQTYYITSEFGYRTHPVTGELQSYHNGIDIGTYGGEPPITAPGPGTVIFAGVKGTYGNCVMISHGFDEKGRNIVTLYAHLSKISVKNGQKVQTGTKLGNVGSTGRSTGNHLHLTVMLDGTPVDPGTYIRILPKRQK